MPDLGEAVAWYGSTFGFQPLWREPDTDVDDRAIGLPGETVRLRGAILDAGTGHLELHQFLSPTGTGSRRVCDTGIGHIAFFTSDVPAATRALRSAGVRFNAAPRRIMRGDLAGRTWVYGADPWGNVLELCDHPTQHTTSRRLV